MLRPARPWILKDKQREGGVMTATRHAVEVGDVVEVSGRRLGEPGRLGEILEVLGSFDHPHYAVRWEDGHHSILYPGETTTIKPRSGAAAPTVDLALAAQLLVEKLRGADVEFELLPHSRTLTAASEARALGVLPQGVAKTVVARDEQGALIRAVVSASDRVSTSKLAEAVSATKVSLLTEAELASAYPQFELGAVPPFGGPAGDRVVVDRRLADDQHVVFDGGVHDTSLRMRTEDLIEVAAARIADIARD
jgi:Ala-tRNA(Pro) deacylase